MISRNSLYKENYNVNIISSRRRPKSKHSNSLRTKIMSKTLSKSSKVCKNLFLTNIMHKNKKTKMLSLQNLITNKNKKLKGKRKNAITEKFRHKFEKIAFSLKKTNLFNKKNMNQKYNLKLKNIFTNKKIRNNFETSVIFQSTKIFIASHKKVQLNILKHQFEFITENFKTTIRLLLDSKLVLNKLTKNAFTIRKEKTILDKIFSYQKLKKKNKVENIFNFIYNCYYLIDYNDDGKNDYFESLKKTYRKTKLKKFVRLICLLFKILELLKEFIKILLFFFKGNDILNFEELELQKNPLLIDLKNHKTYFQIFNKINENIFNGWMAIEKFFELFNHNFLFIFEKYKKVKVFLNGKYLFLVCQNLRLISSNINGYLRNFEKILDIY